MVFWKLFCLILLCLLLFLSYWSFACILRFLIMFLWVLFVCVCFLVVFFFSFFKKIWFAFYLPVCFLEWERKMTRSWVAEGVRMIREEMGEPWSEPTVQKNIIFNKKKSQNVKYIEHVVQWPPDLDSAKTSYVLPMLCPFSLRRCSQYGNMVYLSTGNDITDFRAELNKSISA